VKHGLIELGTNVKGLRFTKNGHEYKKHIALFEVSINHIGEVESKLDCGALSAKEHVVPTFFIQI
jgi:hypothetical protein